jgi:hypothetical protein
VRKAVQTGAARFDMSEIACCAGDLEDLEGVLLILVLLGHQGDIYIGEDPSIP